MMTLGSLFSGSGGFELAGALNGIAPVWASEIEPYPIAVTTSRFPHLEHLGNVSHIDGGKITPVDVITFGSPCFPAGVQVLTKTGYIPIEEVCVGMKVLTHTGKWQTVTATGSKFASTIRLRGNHYGQETTSNHPIYSAELSAYRKGKQLKNIGGWTAAGDMLGKYWAVPNSIVPMHIPSLQPEGRESAKCFAMNEAFFYLVGRWLGDGWLCDSQRSGRPEGQRQGTVVICEDARKSEKLISIARQVAKYVKVEDTRTCVKVKIYSKALSRWLNAHFGKYAYGKTLPGWVYGMPEAQRRALMAGLLDADGYRMSASVYRLTTVSKKLAHSVRLLAETLGCSTTVYFDKRPTQTVIEGRIVNQRDSYMVEMRTPTRKRGVRTERHTWYPVRGICPTNDLKRVYNLTVENDNSYVADSIVVHNCQDVSVAGRQAGIHEGRRSSLFFEAIRIIKEMRCATHGKYPRFAVFENVPGQFSTAKGADFRAVLQAFIDLCDDTLSVPEPPKGRWLHAGAILGDHFSLAWRVLGAEHWGVPQRRNRIYLVADFAGRRAGEVLFEQESLRGHSPEGTSARESASADAEGSAGGSAGFLYGQGVKAHGIGYEEERAPTLRSQAGGNSVPYVLCQNSLNPQSKRVFDMEAMFPTLPAGSSGDQNDQAALCPGMKQQSYLAYALQGNGIDRAETAGCNGCGWKPNVSYTLNTIDRHAVCYQDTVGALCAADWRGPNSQYVGSDKLVVNPLCTDARGNGDGQTCATVTGDHENRVTDYTNIVTYGGDKAGTLDASYYKGAGARNGKEREFVAERHGGRKYIVRRLSTTECARLQGFPDCWAIPVRKESMTDAEAAFWEGVRKTFADAGGKRYRPFSKREQLVRWYNRLHTDSSEYKLYGNGIALPCAGYVLHGVAAVWKGGDAID